MHCVLLRKDSYISESEKREHFQLLHKNAWKLRSEKTELERRGEGSHAMSFTQWDYTTSFRKILNIDATTKPV